MTDNRILTILIIVTVASLGFTVVSYSTQKNRISVPVSAEVALDAIKSEQSAKAFIEENFGEPEDRIERVFLTWDPVKDSYLWEIEIQENSCGCKFNETEGVTIIKASVDPFNGAIYNLSSRVGVPEDTIKREACEKGCHSG